MKRILSLLIALVMAVSMLPVGSVMPKAYLEDDIIVYLGDTLTIYPDIPSDHMVLSCTWTSSNSSCVSVVSGNEYACVVRGVGLTSGTRVTCYYRYARNYSDYSIQYEYLHYYVKVWEPPATSVTIDRSSVSLNPGYSQQLYATVYPLAADQSVSWSSSNTDVATVSENGFVTAKGLGTATIRATVGSLKGECLVNVINPSVSVSQSEFIYNGTEQIPTVTVKDAKSNTITANNYSVVSDDAKSVGVHTLSVIFLGDCSQWESVKKNYTIVPSTVTLKQVNARANGFQAEWNPHAEETTGFQVQYALDAKFNNECKTVTLLDNLATHVHVQDLNENWKYYVRVRTYKEADETTYYSKWSNAVYVITSIIGDDPYADDSGTEPPGEPNPEVPVEPEPVAPVIKKPMGTVISKLTGFKKSFVVKWKKQPKGITGYQVQYATNKQFTKGKKTITVKGVAKTKLTIKKLKAKQKYYVRVRTYKTVNKKNYFSNWSAKKIVITKK